MTGRCQKRRRAEKQALTKTDLRTISTASILTPAQSFAAAGEFRTVSCHGPLAARPVSIARQVATAATLLAPLV